MLLAEMGTRLKIGSREAVMTTNVFGACGRSKPVLVNLSQPEFQSALRVSNIKFKFLGCKKGAVIGRISVIRKDKDAS